MGERRIGKDRFFEDTITDEKFQVTVQGEFGRVWTQIDTNKEKIDKAIAKVEDKEFQKEYKNLLTTVQVMQAKMKLTGKLVYALLASCGSLLIKLLYDFIK